MKLNGVDFVRPVEEECVWVWLRQHVRSAQHKKKILTFDSVPGVRSPYPSHAPLPDADVVHQPVSPQIHWQKLSNVAQLRAHSLVFSY